jgi:colicin import membrane protein
MDRLYDRRGRKSSEGAKAVSEAKKEEAAAKKKEATAVKKAEAAVAAALRKAEKAEEAAEKEKQRCVKVEAKRQVALADAAKARVEMAALFAGDPKDPRLSHCGRVFARALTHDARKLVQREKHKTEMEQRARRRAVLEEKTAKIKMERARELSNAAHRKARKADAKAERLAKEVEKQKERAEMLPA